VGRVAAGGLPLPELRSPVVALSLGGLRRQIEIALLPDERPRRAAARWSRRARTPPPPGAGARGWFTYEQKPGL